VARRCAHAARAHRLRTGDCRPWLSGAGVPREGKHRPGPAYLFVPRRDPSLSRRRAQDKGRRRRSIPSHACQAASAKARSQRPELMRTSSRTEEAKAEIRARASRVNSSSRLRRDTVGPGHPAAPSRQHARGEIIRAASIDSAGAKQPRPSSGCGKAPETKTPPEGGAPWVRIHRLTHRAVCTNGFAVSGPNETELARVCLCRRLFKWCTGANRHHV